MSVSAHRATRMRRRRLRSALLAITLTTLACGLSEATDDAILGEQIWLHQAAGNVSNPVAVAPRAGQVPDAVAFTDASGKLSLLRLSDGTVLWQREVAPATVNPPASADLNGDGVPEIVVPDAEGVLLCVTRQNELLWSRTLPGTVKPYSGVAIGDVDGDGRPDVVCTDDGGNVTCLRADGSTRWTWSTNCRELGAPLIADANGDGASEVFFTAHDYRVFAVGPRGDLMWFRYLPEDMFPNSVPTLGDLNGDGRPELLVGGGLHYLHAFDAMTGAILWREDTNTCVNSAMAVGDVDGDGAEEVLVGVRSGSITCYGAGGVIEWTTHLERSGNEAPAVADFNGDGVPENVWFLAGGAVAVLSADGTVLARNRDLQSRSSAHPLLIPTDGEGNHSLVASWVGGMDRVVCARLLQPVGDVVYGAPRGNARRSGDYVARRIARRAPVSIEEASGSAGLHATLPENLLTGANVASFGIADTVTRQTSFLLVVDGPAGKQFIHREAYPGGARQTIAFRAEAAGAYHATAWAVRSGELVRHRLAERSWRLRPFRRDLERIDGLLSEIRGLARPGDPVWSGARREAGMATVRLSGLRRSCERPPREPDAVALLADSVTALRRDLVLMDSLAAVISARQGRGNASPIVAWGTNPWNMFSLDRYLPPRRAQSIAVESCLGEHESVRLAVFNTSERHLDVRVMLSDLRSDSADAVVSARAVELSRVVDVPAYPGREVDDALAPLGPAQVFTVPSWSTAGIWLTVNPRDVPPGRYTGSLTLLPLVIGMEPEIVPVELTVFPVVLPDRSPLRMCLWTMGNEGFLSEWQDEALADLEDHYCSVFASAPGATCTYDSTGSPTGPMDYTASDEQFRRLKPLGMLLVAGPQGGPQVQGAARFSEPWQRAYRHFITTWMAHLDSLGITRDDFAFYPIDEPHFFGGAAEEEFLQTARATRNVDPTIRIYTDPTTGSPPELIDQFAPYVDIWCPSQELLNRDAHWLVPRLKATGATMWAYDAAGKAKMLSSLHHQRHQAWQAWVNGFTGIGYWVYAHHGGDVSRWMSSIYDPPDFYCSVYEGRGPIPSRRWECMREGVEDWLLLNELRQARQQASEAGVGDTELARADYLLNDMPVGVRERLRDSGRYLNRPASPTSIDEIWLELDEVRRELVAEIVRLRGLTEQARR